MSRYSSRYVDIPNLNELMIAAGASNIALAEAAGVALRTVAMARCGKSQVEKYNRDAILQALEERSFALQKRGRKPKCSTTSK